MKLRYAIAQLLGSREDQEDFCGLRNGDTVVYLQGGHPIDGIAIDGLSCVLCDGMGGHAAGEMASRLVGEAFLASLIPNCSPQLTASLLSRVASELNARVADAIHQVPSCSGMGTTFIGVKIENSLLKWASVGDSHLYMWRAGTFHKLNDDHSMRPVISSMVERGIITESEAKTHPDRNALRAALTGNEVSLVDVEAEGVGLLKGDIVCLASDGLDTLSGKELISAIRWSRFFGPKSVSGAILRKVRRRKIKGQDNVSIILIVV